jgi:ligand-binding sensor domain-containing protein
VLTASRIDAILPVFGVRKLFVNEPCYAVAVESGNRKWIGTANGLYLFNNDGTELIAHFTAANSPLPSSIIKVLQFEEPTGLLFVETPGGMIAYRTSASAPSDNLSMVTIFPNPVTPGYAGVLGIKGLKNDCVVKITTLSGRLVYETRSQGGTASWNLIDYTGRRASGGIYLIMAVSDDKSANFAGKFAIIDGNH